MAKIDDINAVLAKIQADVAALQSQPQGLTPAQADAVIATLNTISATLASLLPPA